MKQFYSTLFILLTAFTGYSQAVLNEIYAYPSVDGHEFFELYNTSTSQSPISVDGYTLISYFEEDNNTKGFYVMDLPNLNMAPMGFLVGSSAIPFNFQGNNGSTASNFNWNDLTFMAANYGYVRKWVKNGGVFPLDGNPFYNEAPLPANFNDFFSHKTGSGASYNAFLYKDGVLINCFIGGTGGRTFIPNYISSMPFLFVEKMTAANVAAGTKPTFLVDFGGYSNAKPEFVIQDIGTDNGYMRETDGLCGSWEKSSSQAFHTPLASNGTIQMDDPGQLTIETHITRGLNPGDPSFITYNVTAGPAELFPVDLYIYADNGLEADRWDANDGFLEGNTETIVSNGPFTTYFQPYNQQLILVVKTAPGCYDQLRLIPNPDPVTIPLPIKLKMFTGKATDQKSLLEWVVTDNKSGQLFEVERSVNGKDFTKIAAVAVTAKEDEEYYSFQEPLSGHAYYRLKIVNKDGSTSYSAVVFVKESKVAAEQLFIVQNPVEATLVFTYQSTQTGQSTINIYNAVGVKLFSTQKSAQKGSNTYSINLDQKFTSGTYLLEVVNNTERSIERFIRR